MIKVLIRYFSRFYELIDANADMLLPNNKRNNAAEEDIDKFLDFLLISLIKDSDDMFFIHIRIWWKLKTYANKNRQYI